jgi:hypothetical protein
VEGTEDVDVWTALLQSIKFYDILCIVPVYLAVRSLMGQSFRNIWLLLLAQFSIILYIFLSGSFVINAQLVSFSMLLIPISTDAYKGVIQWKKKRILHRLDGMAHLTTAIMLIYHHPYEGSDQDHRGYIIASVLVGFLLGRTAQATIKEQGSRQQEE